MTVSANQSMPSLTSYPKQQAVSVGGMSQTVFDLLWADARHEAMDFIKPHLGTSLVFRNQVELWTYILEKIPSKGLLIELGVLKGVSINYFAQVREKMGDDRTIYGFDSFEGLSEDWVGHHRPAGSYTTGGKLPEVHKHVELIKGWVEDTFPPFLENKAKNANQKIALLHIDTDTYSPCKLALEESFPYWMEGTIIMFDELIGYPGWKVGEYKAFMEFQDTHKFTFDYIGFSNNQAAIKITSL